MTKGEKKCVDDMFNYGYLDFYCLRLNMDIWIAFVEWIFGLRLLNGYLNVYMFMHFVENNHIDQIA